MIQLIRIAFMLLLVQDAFAQTYPARPVRIIFPFTAGSLYDGMARAMAVPMGESMGQPVVVENRPGASSIIGMSACAKSPPDGYTVCLTTNDSITYNPLLFTNLPYDAENDFLPVATLIRPNGAVVSSASAPFASFKDMIAYAKASPGKVNFATWGAASIPEIHMNWIMREKGVTLTPIPYKGAGQAYPALVAGEVQTTYIGLGAAMPHIKAGKVRALGVVGAKRSPFLPDTPTLSEEGADSGLENWIGVFAPARTSRPVIDRLNAELLKALVNARVQDFLRVALIEPAGSSPEEFAALLRKTKADATRVFKALGLKPANAPES